MEQRIVKLQISNEYIIGSGVSVGAVGSHDDVLLEMDFHHSAVWAGTTRRAIFANALGENRTVIILTTNLLEDGQAEIYLVPVPQQAKEVAGECFLTVEGFVTDGNGKEIVRCVTEEARFRVLPSKLYTNDSSPVTPSQSEQLQAEIDDIKQKIILAAQAANSAEDAEEAKTAAEEAKDRAELNARNARVMAEGGKYETKSGEISSYRAVPGAKNYANQAYVYAEGGTFDDNPFDDIPSTIRSDGAKNLANKAKAFAEGGSYKEWEKNGLDYEWKTKTVEKGAKQYAEAAADAKKDADSSADDSKNYSENSAQYSYRSKVYAVGETILSKGFSVSAGEKKIFNTVGPDGRESSLRVPFVEVGRLYSIKVGTETKIVMATEDGISAFGLIITNAGSTNGVYSYYIENTNDSAVSGSILSSFAGGKSAKEYAESALYAKTAAEAAAEAAKQAAQDAKVSAASAADDAKFIRESTQDINSDFKQLRRDVDDLMYVPIQITSFSADVGTVELGQTVTAVTLNWAVNKTPASLTLDGEALDPALRTKQLEGLSVTEHRSWTLTATDERGHSASKTTSITFLNGVYYGVSAEPETVDSTFLMAMTKVLSSSKLPSFSVDAGAGQYIWYAVPSRFGACVFKFNNMEGGMDFVDTLEFENSCGYKESYDVYRSENAGLGSMTWEVS